MTSTTEVPMVPARWAYSFARQNGLGHSAAVHSAVLNGTRVNGQPASAEEVEAAVRDLRGAFDNA